MSESDDAPLLPVSMIPASWACICPVCGDTVEIDEVSDDDAGVYYPVDENCVVFCSCGAALCPTGARVTVVADTPYRGRP